MRLTIYIFLEHLLIYYNLEEESLRDEFSNMKIAYEVKSHHYEKSRDKLLCRNILSNLVTPYGSDITTLEMPSQEIIISKL